MEGVRVSLPFLFALCTLRRPHPHVSKLPLVSTLTFTPAEDQNRAIKSMQMVSYVTSSAGIFHCLTLSKKENKRREDNEVFLPAVQLTALSSRCCQAWRSRPHQHSPCTLPLCPAMCQNPTEILIPPWYSYDSSINWIKTSGAKSLALK